MSETIEKHSVQERAYALLKTMIADGRLAPGQKLLEAQVAKAFGISRSPARYALQALCNERLVNEASGRGYEVAGKMKPGVARERAVLDEVKIAAVQQWERIYVELERELCARVMFVSVRIVEERLAEHFGVSRTVARDVLARMHSVGLVAKDAMGRWIATRITPDKTHHLYELRWLLEPEALQQAASHVSSDYLEQLRETVVDALDGFPREGFDTDVVEHDLHIRLLSHCPNGEILQALARTRMLFVPTRYLFDPVLRIPLTSIEDALNEHRTIYDLLLAKKPAKAAAALHAHLKQADARWLQRFEGAASATLEELPPYLTRL
ncbi:transcriptional regulator [Burkholderia sp. Ch1-1]|jgi:DNA-binding GntR family transcriptional regulator|uniref:Transcriptional regulator n=1 Tax=Paraburkholderia dioscoreae TaxID=2604047 RepID=A0A5Q4ZRP3_9BURK|nr:MULTISPECIES: GntR family transcriptional regulator [Paraburkholderia]EIF35632.1 transcriptional regulator [Burkholderia sp. Ch1-1]MDR8400535.1 GntR family transcriptional regulator [Paraburkholderia sp. USG1]VVD31540.1 Transcriptional regulator [Paraburkholderia dioscoreae]